MRHVGTQRQNSGEGVVCTRRGECKDVTKIRGGVDALCKRIGFQRNSIVFSTEVWSIFPLFCPEHGSRSNSRRDQQRRNASPQSGVKSNPNSPPNCHQAASRPTVVARGHNFRRARRK